MRTARRLGVKTVAVYSDADARAMHVSEADEVCIFLLFPWHTLRAASQYISICLRLFMTPRLSLTLALHLMPNTASRPLRLTVLVAPRAQTRTSSWIACWRWPRRRVHRVSIQATDSCLKTPRLVPPAPSHSSIRGSYPNPGLL